jgi:hypothetical protein
MTVTVDRLEIVRVIRSAFRFRQYVVNLMCWADAIGRLALRAVAQVLISSENHLAKALPSCAVTTLRRAS